VSDHKFLFAQTASSLFRDAELTQATSEKGLPRRLVGGRDVAVALFTTI
jgi:hypothetical protein